MSDTHRNTDNGSEQNTQQKCAAHFFNQQNRSNQQAYQAEQGSTRSNLAQADEGGIVIDNDTCILQSQKGNEQADAGANGVLQGERQCVYYLLAQVGYREQNENKSLQQYGCQGKLPRVAHGQADRIGKKGVQSHTRCQSEWQLCIHSHQQGGKSGSYDCGSEQGTFIHTRSTQDIRIYSQNIGHRQKRSNTRQNFRTDGSYFGIKPKQSSKNHT